MAQADDVVKKCGNSNTTLNSSDSEPNEEMVDEKYLRNLDCGEGQLEAVSW